MPLRRGTQVHWSILAYTGLVKILKKHHKRTGLLVRAGGGPRRTWTTC